MTIGIVGGYGAVGEVVARELCRSSSGRILIGGRRLEAAQRLAAELGPAVGARHVDVYDHQTLLQFGKECQIVINCAGPSSRVLGRVARAALECRTHYVDPSAFGVHEAVGAQENEIRDHRLVFLLGVGWSPGLTELMAHRAAAELEEVERVSVYVQDQSVWTENSCEDLTYLMGEDREVGLYLDGVWTARKLSLPRRRRFPRPFGGQWVLPRRWPELEGLVDRLRPREAGFYLRGDLLSQAFFAATRVLLKGRKRLAARIMQNVLKVEQWRGSGGGLVQAEAVGRHQGQSRTVEVRMAFTREKHYFMSAIPAVVVTRMILEGKSLSPGMRYLADAVDPRDFLTALGSEGISHQVGGPGTRWAS